MNRTSEQNKRGAQVDESLRRAFQPTLDEDLPDRFRSLLAALRDGKDADDEEDTRK
ncbi:hypothetical protein HKCCE2091_05600 [Rhodobacterales bacterium HKCCE2091]|nr:hypothetical protein [Rhodobacterales bacterium HKCCE2091]